ncbi:MAG: 1-acyl-sn-glycerol-3-phosphate acyltransferase, partial [Bacteroides sp.]
FFLGKKELANLPILGFFFKNIDLGIDRNNKDYNKSILQQCSKNLSDGISMIIFPEGTISKNGKRLMNFKNGAFYLSIINKIPIIPISIINAKYIFYNNGLRYGSKPGIIDVVVHSTVFIKKNMNVDTLKSQIFNIIDKSLK